MRVRILNAEPEGYCDEARTVLRELGELTEEPVPQERLAARARDFEVLIVRLGLRVTEEVLDGARALRAVVTATTGMDHIDVAAAADRGVAVLSLRGETEFLRTIPATAEHTWALLLALVRHLPWAFDDVRNGAWERNRFRGRDLAGRRLGILGLGRIGERIARYGLAFGMTTGAYDPYRQGWLDGVERVATLESLLAWSEVLSVHLPLNDETRGLLGRERLALLPRGALVINTARGAVLDEQALVALLEAAHLGGAAVDVLADEQLRDQLMANPIIRYAKAHTNLLVTPHIGGATWDSMGRTEVFMAEKLRHFLSQGAAGTKAGGRKTVGEVRLSGA